MELRHLKYFVAVAEEENVTRAASLLHVSQPPLSRQIRDLEEELGVKLFERKPQSLVLTPAGRVFLVEARAVLARAHEALRVAASLAGRRQAEIRIGYAPSLTVEMLPCALRQFQAKAGHVRVRLHDLSTGKMLEGLKKGDLDIALMIRPHATELRGVNFRALKKYAVCLAMHPAHPLADLKRIPLSTLNGERIIAYDRDEYPEYHLWLSDLFCKQAARPLIAQEHDSSTSLIASVEAGLGVALVQEGFECFSGPRLVIRPVRPAPPPFVVGAAWLKGSKDQTVSAFLDALNAFRPLAIALKKPPPKGKGGGGHTGKRSGFSPD